MIKQSLTIKFKKSNGDVVTFPEGMIPAKIGTFTYEAQRMGSAPTLTATLYYPSCLDDKWTGKEYVEFRGTKYYAFRKPVSSKGNSTYMYQHEMILVDERIVLENTFFLDVVTANTDNAYKDRYRSNTTSFSFMGTVVEFVARLNDSMIYSGLAIYENGTYKDGYKIVIDEGYGTDDNVEIKLDNTYIADAIQEIYKSYNLNYYWVGKVCHIGDYKDSIGDSVPLEYQNGLLSVNIDDTNNKIFDRITGVGSSGNIPYYYPNDNAEGKAIFDVQNIEKSLVADIHLDKIYKYNTNVYQDTFILCKEACVSIDILRSVSGYEVSDAHPESTGKGQAIYPGIGTGNIYKIESDDKKPYPFTKSVTMSPYINYTTDRNLHGEKNADSAYNITAFIIKGKVLSRLYFDNLKAKTTITSCKASADKITSSNPLADGDNNYKYDTISNTDISKYLTIGDTRVVDVRIKKITDRGAEFKYGDFEKLSDYYTFLEEGYYMVLVTTATGVSCIDNGKYNYIKTTISVSFDGELTNDPRLGNYLWNYGDNKIVKYEDSGIELVDVDSAPCARNIYQFSNDEWTNVLSNADSAAKINISKRDYITPSANLMPSIYRSSKGERRFYNAENGKYKDANGNFISFNNIFTEGNPHEGKQDFLDIKPTIKGITNASGELIGEIEGIAFDEDDNDLKVGDSDNFEHPYFYIKLRRFDHEHFGFNLFQRSIESEEMTINVTDGTCAACSFKVLGYKTQIDNEYKFHNPVHVDASGNLVVVNTNGKNTYILPEGHTQFDGNNQNTFTDSLWVAVQKDISTFGVIMPNRSFRYMPSKGDKFVITGIKMPNAYVEAAEKRLDDALIQYMKENNDVVTSMNVTFSRDWLRYNQSIISKLSDSSRIFVKYNNKTYNLFVSNYTCRADESTLSEISITLSAKLSANTSQTETQVSELVGKYMGSVSGDSVDINAIMEIMKSFFLSKTDADSANGFVQFLQGLSATSIKSNGNVGSETFLNSLTVGKGWNVNKDGNAQLESLEIRSALKVYDMIFNRLNAQEGDIVFSESGTIENVTQLQDGTYRLEFQKRNDSDLHAFRDGDILRGVVNDVNSLDLKIEYTSWMKVIEYDHAGGANSAIVSIYKDEDVPSGRNYMPSLLMKVHRWGNATNTARQSTWYISSTEKRIVMLDGVDKPILKENNYAAFFGLPYGLSNFKGLPVNSNQPYIYCRGAFLENIYHIDYKGQIIKSERYRGEWSEVTAKSDDPYVTTDATYDTVYYNNAKWQCVVSKAEDAPSSSNAEWTKLMDGVLPRYTIVPSVERVVRDKDGSPNVTKVTCDVVRQLGDEEPTYVGDDVRKVYITKNQDIDTLIEGREVVLSANDGVNTIEFYMFNSDSVFGEMDLGDSIFSYLTGKQTVEVIVQGANGTDGTDAQIVNVSTTSITAKKLNENQFFEVIVTAMKGGKKVIYGAENDFVCSTLAEGQTIQEGLLWSYSMIDKWTFRYRIALLAGYVIDKIIPFVVTLNGIEYNYEILFNTFDAGVGSKGNRGAVLRTSMFVVGADYQSGAEGETFVDAVYIEGAPDVWYYCIKSHKSAEGEDPLGDASLGEDAVNWKSFDKYEAIATKLLLSEKGKINNLVVDDISIQDEDGNDLLVANKDGVTANGGVFNNISANGGTFTNITANNGTFNNVKVSGELVGVTGLFEGVLKASAVIVEPKRIQNQEDENPILDFENNPSEVYDILTYKGVTLDIPDATNYIGRKIQFWSFYLSTRSSVNVDTPTINGTFIYNNHKYVAVKPEIGCCITLVSVYSGMENNKNVGAWLITSVLGKVEFTTSGGTKVTISLG